MLTSTNAPAMTSNRLISALPSLRYDLQFVCTTPLTTVSQHNQHSYAMDPAVLAAFKALSQQIDDLSLDVAAAQVNTRQAAAQQSEAQFRRTYLGDDAYAKRNPRGYVISWFAGKRGRRVWLRLESRRAQRARARFRRANVARDVEGLASVV